MIEKKTQKTELKLKSIDKAIVLSGLDNRFHWSRIPIFLSLTFTLVMIFGFLMLFLVFKQNSYASRKIEIQEGQKLIDT